MKNTLFKVLIIILFTSVSFSLTAQFGGGGRPGAGGLFSVASPAKSGRFVTVGGRLSPARKIGHSIAVSGYVQTILVKVGDRVEPGQSLVRITRDIVGETFLPVILESRITGIVSEIHVYEKQEVSTGTLAVTVLDNSSYLLNVSLSDRDAQAIRSLGSIPVTGTTPEGMAFQGKIQSISLEPDYNTGLFTLIMSFPYKQGLFLGMVLFVDLAAQKEEGITVENTAVVNEGDKSFLWVLNEENQLTRREVSIGKEVELKITIDSGLKAGERYVREISGNEKEGMSTRDLIQINMSGSSSAGSN
ncbi:MAG: HlyD family efflux transporter periplasmic adaptor subunit [Spirochaetaceae bacterium]|jgi:multidrug efflux pump subunit AcrA (membrane-fusion protein)|nr:HlyD family efflux transporter periplasmic adaptor subunit [Spirochaetaceae bacterium]